MNRALLTAAFLSTAGNVAASDYCVSSEAELMAALQAAESSPEADRIKLRDVLIPITTSLFFSPFGTSTGGLEVSGGWEGSCVSRKFGAQWTSLQASTPQLQIGLSPDDDLTVSDLNMIGFGNINFSNPTVGPAVTTLKLSRVGVFRDTMGGDALSMFSDAERIEVDHLLVDAVARCGVALATFSNVGQVIVRSSTVIVRPDPDNAFSGDAICFDGAPNAELNASINSIYSSNGGADVRVNGRPVLMQASAYGDIEGLPEPLDPESSSNIVAPLAFEEQASGPHARFVRVAQSTALMPGLIDSGEPQNVLEYPYDVLGRPRGLGSNADRGAFELSANGFVFHSGFEGS